MERQDQPAPIGGGQEARTEQRIDAIPAETMSHTAPAMDVTTEQPTRAQDLQATVEDGPAEREREASPMAVDVPEENVILPEDPTTKRTETARDATADTGPSVEERREADSNGTPSAQQPSASVGGVQSADQTTSTNAQPRPEVRAEQVPVEESAALGQPLGVELQMDQQARPRPEASSTSQKTQQAVQQPSERSHPSPSAVAQEERPEQPSIPIEHARQPYSSQSSNTRFGPAAQAESSGQRQTQAGAGAAARGMPMLSGRPPFVETDTCRACGKYFIPLIRKRHFCNHCGYSYCGDDCSGSALMPRQGTRAQGAEVLGARNGEGGYEMVEVCGYCAPMLQVTSGHPPFLRSLPLKRLQTYTKAYGLNTTGAIEKEDFVQTILKAKNPVTGCLPPDAESYYRRRSVPKQGVMPTPPAPSPRPPQPRPGGQQNAQRPQQYRPTYGTQTSPRASPAPGYRPGYMPSPQPVRPSTGFPRPAATPPPRPKASPQPRPPSPPVPTILSLVALPQSYIASLSIGTLKAILYENHVKVDFSQVLEKGELVRRVQMLVAEERKRLERQRAAEEAEEAEERGARASVDGEPVRRTDSPDLTAGAEAIPVPTGPKASVERDGLCVVCQDQEAVFANIDCGHLCMCPDCSKLVMATTRECPMCRTRIVTEQRLIRIFRT